MAELSINTQKNCIIWLLFMTILEYTYEFC